MNHDKQLKKLVAVLNIITISYTLEIAKIKDPKHRTELIQEMDKMDHYKLKMIKCLDDMNCWFTAFGADGNAQNS